MNQLRISRIRRKVKTHLDKERYEHTLGVMYTASALAMRYEVDLEKAMIAGLLHDCAKCLSSDKKIKLCEKYKLSVSEVERENPGLLHAKLGAFLANKKYHIQDTDIIDSIANHTTGRPDMTKLDKIIYIADFIEPHRLEIPNLDYIRHLAFIDLDECLYTILTATLHYLNNKGVAIDDLTEQTYSYYKSKLAKK